MRLRGIYLGLALPLVAPAQAQFSSDLFHIGFQRLYEKKLVEPPDQENPTQPSGFKTPPPKREGDLPMAGPLGPEGGSLQILQSGQIESDGPLIHVAGPLEFTDRGYHCWADEMQGDRRTDTYTLKGNVRIVGQDESVYGDLVQVNFTNRTFVADNTDDTLKPPLVGGRLKDNLYVKAQHSNGSRQEIWAEKTVATTCSYPSPHFEIVADRTDVRPGRRVIFRKVKLVILGHTILNLPYLSVPLDERTYNNLPEFGHGTLEGYFVKNRYAFPLSGNSVIQTRLDYFTRLGTGFGAGTRFDTRFSRANINVYTIQGPHKELDITGQYRQQFGKATLTLDGSYQGDNYLVSSSSKVLNTRGLLFMPSSRGNDVLTYYRTSSQSTGSNTLQQTITFDDSRGWTPKLNTKFDLQLSNNTSQFTGGDAVHREELDVRFQAMDDLQKATARLDYIRSIPIGETTHFFTTSDVTPAITFATTSTKMFGPTMDQRFPFDTQVAYGEYGDPLTRGRITRADFQFNFRNPNPVRPPTHWDLNYQAGFKQDVYSDNTAQYVLRESTELTYHFRTNSRFNISYNYLRPEGFTPLQIDRQGQTNNFIADLSFSPFKHALIGVATGYDFLLIKEHQPTPWQQVGLRASYTLGRYFEARLLSTYDTIQHAYSSTRFDLKWIPGSTYVSFGGKYDGLRNKLAAANIFIDGLKTGRLRSSILLNYNGYTKQFDSEHFSFIYDLHCAEAVLQVINNPTGFNGGRTVYFFVRLKALPFDTPFGTGTRGQPIGTGTGRDF